MSLAFDDFNVSGPEKIPHPDHDQYFKTVETNHLLVTSYHHVHDVSSDTASMALMQSSLHVPFALVAPRPVKAIRCGCMGRHAIRLSILSSSLTTGACEPGRAGDNAIGPTDVHFLMSHVYTGAHAAASTFI